MRRAIVVALACACTSGAWAQSVFWPPAFHVNSVRCNASGSAMVQMSVDGIWFCPAIPTGVRVEPGNVILNVVVEWAYTAPPPCASVLTPWRYDVQFTTSDLDRSIPVIATFAGPLGLEPVQIGQTTFDCCPADRDDGSGLGHPDGGVTIDDLLYYLGIFGEGSAAADIDDGSGTGTRDGGVTIDDLLYYLVRFEEGC